MFVSKATLVSMLLCPFVAEISAKTVHPLEYGNKCELEKSPICDPEKRLQCINATCGCSVSNFYDKGAKSCLIEIGSYCLPVKPIWKKDGCGGDSSCEEVRDYALPRHVHTGFNVPAIHVCTCEYAYGPDDARQSCIHTAHVGEACSNTTDKGGKLCDPTARLMCGANNKCECRPKGSYYDNMIRSCAIRKGDKCQHGSQCEHRTICSIWIENGQYIAHPAISYYERNIVENTTTGWNSHGECICQPGLTTNSKDKCAGTLHAECSEDDECNEDEFLTCIDSICQCEKGMSQVFTHEHGNGSCRIPVGGACFGKKGAQCVGNAFCYEGHCKLSCDKGMSPTYWGKCFASYGSSCDVVEQEFCNRAQGLACTHEKLCKCFDASLTWNKTTTMCEAKVGERCGQFALEDATMHDFDGSDDLPKHHLQTAGPIGNYAVGCAGWARCVLDDVTQLLFCEKH